MWLFLQRETGVLSDELDVLHIAPEPAIAARLRKRPNLTYVSADIEDKRSPMELMDITALPRADETFDVVICSHVLEHVDADATAMRELLRVLRPGGVAYVQVPIDHRRAETYEDPSITRPEDRAREFEQDDHVRVYGRDFADRLRNAGFEVTRRAYYEEVDPGERSRFGLGEPPRVQWFGDIFVSVKPKA
jgi:SAM-dependent methyltransferase